MILFSKKKASLSILIGKKATTVEKFAASELQKYLKHVGGINVTVAEQDEVDDDAFILLGQPETNPAVKKFIGSMPEELPEDSLLIKSVKDKLILTGKGERGVLYSVYTFLERYVGCRWYAPGEEGELIPELRNLELKDIEHWESPDFPYRGMMTHRDKPEEIVQWIDWMAKQKMNYFMIWLSMWDKVKDGIMDEVRKRGMQLDVGHHSFFYWLPPRVYFAEHPEYFCLKDGKRQFSPEGESEAQFYQPCTTNPDVARIMSENIKDFIRNNPEVQIIGLWPNDIPQWCECDKCVAFDTQGEDQELLHKPIITRRYISFCNTVAEAVAEEFPDKRLSVIAYHTAVIPAEDMIPAPNIDICFAPYDECYAHSLGEKSCKRNRFFAENVEKWIKQGNRVYLYGYYLKGTWGQLPFPIISRILEDMRYYKSVGMIGANTQAELITWPTHGLIYYAYANGLWNSERDLDELLDDYCDGFYGESGPVMKRYFLRLEEAMRRAGEEVDPFCSHSWRHFPSRLFQPEVMSDCKDLLDQAEKAARNETVLRRIHFQKTYLRYAELVVSALDMKGEEKYEEALAAMEEILSYGKEDPEWKSILVYSDFLFDGFRRDCEDRLKSSAKQEVRGPKAEKMRKMGTRRRR